MKSVIVLSGGMDSLTALAEMINRGDEIVCLNFQYGSKHNAKENEAIKKITEHFRVPLKQIVLDFNDYLKSDLLNSGGEIPEGHYAAENMKKTVIPFRNGIMLSIAAGFAESIEASTVVLGNHAGDHAIYPDCRATFVDAMDKAINLGTYAGIRLFSPFLLLTKGQIVSRGIELGVPYEHSWSCYKGGDIHCGKCGTCVERLEAFEQAGIQDPLPYEDRDYYKSVLQSHPSEATI